MIAAVTTNSRPPRDGDACQVTGGMHKGKSGIVHDLNVGKTGHLTITVVQKNGERFKTLAKNVRVMPVSGD
ncbi:MAG: hypothetical protein R3F08_10360 [Dokdonella sp.]